MSMPMAPENPLLGGVAVPVVLTMQKVQEKLLICPIRAAVLIITTVGSNVLCLWDGIPTDRPTENVDANMPEGQE